MVFELTGVFGEWLKSIQRHASKDNARSETVGGHPGVLRCNKLGKFGHAELTDKVHYGGLKVRGLIRNQAQVCCRHQLTNPATWFSRQPPPSRAILQRLTGTIRQGEMLMVVGRPGSGCTTVLKALANMREEYLAMEGDVWYGSMDAGTTKQVRANQVAFVGEDDIHFPTLSVSTTLKFALNTRRSISDPDRAQHLQQDLQTVLELMGLAQAAHVRIGSDHIRGVSGGQRRRVSLAEALCTRASLFCFDNPTRGLDSSTAIRFLTTMRKYTTRGQCMTAMSLYQASDSAVALFDKVLVLNDGHVAYYGPATSAKAYFESIGFYCSPRMSVSDFLASMSGTPEGRITREDLDRPVPIHPADFETRFRESSFYRQAVSTAATPSQLKPVGKPKASGYALPLYRQVYECTVRHYQIFLTDRAAWIAEAAGTIIQALLLGTLFRNQRAVTEGLYTRASALFFCVLIMGLQASAEFGNTFVQRPILLKQKALRFYRPGAYALGQILADVPWKFIFIMYSLPIYWMINFQRTAGHFFTWLVCLYMGLMALSVMFRAIAVFTNSITRAILPVGLLLNVFIIYTGFYITPPGMKVWLFWIRYLDPMYYIFESVALNEIGTSSYQCSTKDIVPRGAAYNETNYQACAMSGSVPGELSLAGRLYLMAEYGFKHTHLWRNVGINAAFFLFFSVVVMIGMERFRHAAEHMSTIFYRRLPSWVRASASRSADIEEPPMASETKESKPSSNHDVTTIGRLEATQSVFAWQGLSLQLDDDKRLLHEVSGWLQPGKMTALMGMSGAGKTTLLDTLAQRIQIGRLSGGLYLNGQTLPASMGRRTGFVHQNDIHLASSTVREALQLSACLRRPATVSWEEKMDHVEMLIQLLQMEDIAEAIIGVPGAGLNLEQRKRVSIGVELAAKPDIVLFLDEPTSGLDGNSALSIVQLMRRLSDAGQTILCTIHQPSAQMIEQFDNLLLLVPGGKTVYFGPLGSRCQKILDYFARYTRRCGETENPADYLLAVSAEPDKDWFQTWQGSPEYGSTQEQLQRLLQVQEVKESSSSDPDRTYAASYLDQLRVVTQRAFTNYWRDSDYVLGKIQLNIWMGLMNGLTFLQLSNDLTDARGRMFSIFVGVITGPVLSLQIEPRFILLRDQFLARENESRVYHWSIFTISALLVEIPFTLLGGLIYWLLWYYMVGYLTVSTRAGYAFLMYELYSLFVASLAQLTASLFPTVLAAQVATGFIWLVVNTFNGPLSPPPLTPRGWRWFYNISPLFYFIEGIGTNAMHALQITCRNSELTTFEAPVGETCASYTAEFFGLANSTGYLVDPNATGLCEYCAYADGDEYVQQYDMSYSQRGNNVGIFIGFILFNYTMAVLATYLIFIFKWRKRRSN
ncbi:P-loop containing nucleoside triphosphate hydrolase protein [Aspergillus pseudotamarii]|uniref:P-loop containing nucleoside triphosphate hydrolase protein n=1 Tax=Aspergillus pseudotamarii TaxID=132259 RepID=A0A5N6SPM9_ASPPS|nr:P-loop containing nucleoside triphosphate hydrolase protein [Aspergillus pseudotamarii]KAE8135084.1 P-loop containing nucleoside triphosphate hydrolase protein [Aspergillus pseudotamarii]